jgi:hypothetical protein
LSVTNVIARTARLALLTDFHVTPESVVWKIWPSEVVAKPLLSLRNRMSVCWTVPPTVRVPGSAVLVANSVPPLSVSNTEPSARTR